MCGKFTALVSWSAATLFPESRPIDPNDRIVSLRVMSAVNVIIFDHEAGARRVVPMRWGFPHPQDWRRPQPIHARSETIEITRAFADAFLDGQRGIVLMNAFNEAPDIDGPTVQHTITPEEGAVLACALVWRRFAVPNITAPLMACVQVTVPANGLVCSLPTDRMPAFLEKEDWPVWLGEVEATVDEIKACLKTTEGAKWTMTREERRADPKTKRAKPVMSDPTGFL